MLLNQLDHARILEATRAAESKSRGQIVCVVADEASHYVEVPLAWAVVGALVLPLLMVVLGVAADWLDFGLGGWTAGHVAADRASVMMALGGYALLQGVLFVLIALIVSIPPVRRALTPALLRRGHVHKRAMEQFYARNLHATREGNGVLIYASLKDRIAEVIADAGIDGQVGARGWAKAIGELTAGIKAGRPGDGFVAAIETCGQILAAHYPAGGGQADDLPDDLIEISEN